MRILPILCGAVCLFPVSSALATISASADMTPTTLAPGGADAYQYDLTLHNSGDTGISTFWYAWDDSGLNFLSQYPDNVTAPPGWYGYVTASYSYSNFSYLYTYGIEWYSFQPVAAGEDLSGFSFQSNQTPADLSGNSNQSADPVFPIGTSFVYENFPPQQPGDDGFQFTTVPAVAVPEPTSMGVVSMAAMTLLARRRSRRSAE